MITGFPFKSKAYTDNPTDVYLLRGDNCGQSFLRWEKAKRWPKEEYEDFPNYHLKLNDVVLAMDRPWISSGLKYSWIKETDLPSLLVQRVARMRGENGLNTNYLRMVIGSPDFTNHVLAIITGVNVPHISGRDIKSFRFQLPPLPIQKRIVGILSAYDDLIEVNTRRIKALEEMARRTYEEWFERGVEDNWPSVNFENIANIHRGKSYRSADLVQSEHSVPLINLKNIQSWGGFRRDGFKTYSGDAKSKHHAVPGDLLLAVTDMTQERRLIAECAKVPKLNSSHAVFSMDLVKVQPKEQVEKTFFYGFLRWSQFSRTLKEFANGANVLHLSPKAIAAYEFELPPMELQLKYSNKVQSMLQLMESLEEINTNLRAQRNLLLPRLISGEIDVSDAPLAEAAE